MKVGQSNTYADQACRPMTTTRTRTGKTADLLPILRPPKYPRKEKISPIRYAFRKRNVPKICASTTGYLVFLRRSADCFTDKNGSPGKTRHANMYVLYVPDSPTSRREPDGPSRAKPQIRNIYIERHPSNAPARPYPKGPTGYTASFHRRAVLVPIFRRNRSPYISHRQQQKKKRTRGAATRARVVAAVRTLMNPARQHVCVVCAGLPDQSTRTRWTLPCQTPNSEHIYREASQQRACSAVPQRPHRLHSFLPSEGSSGPDFSAESFSLHFAQTAAKEETHQGGGDAREGGGGGADAHGCC